MCVVDVWRHEFGHGLGLHVAVLELPFVVGLEQHCTDQADDRALVGEDADDIGAALDLLVEAFNRVGAVALAAVLCGEVNRSGFVGGSNS